MIGFLEWIEASPLGVFMRESSAWTYALVNLAHVLGIGTLFGSVVLLDLALLGVWRRASLPALADAAAPVAAAAFILAALSGVGLLSSNATEYEGNPFFAIKFPVIGLAVINAVAIKRSTAWRAVGTRELTASETVRLRWMAGLSLASWIAAIAAGRMIGYW